MPCGALEKFVIHYAMPIRLCLLFLWVMNLIISLKKKAKKKKTKQNKEKKQKKPNITQTSIPDMSANSSVWANLNKNSLARFVNAKGKEEWNCVLTTDTRNNQAPFC